jgi:hypothetical protein
MSCEACKQKREQLSRAVRARDPQAALRLAREAISVARAQAMSVARVRLSQAGVMRVRQ